MLQGDEVVMGYGKRIDNEVEAAETLSKLVASTNNGVFFWRCRRIYCERNSRLPKC